MSLYRNAVWFVKGLKEYTKTGYEGAAKSFSASDLETNLEGRSYMVTGANSGIGKVAAKAIAKRGGVVHMVCRNPERGEEAKSEIVQDSNNQNVFLHILDMSKPRDVVQFAQKFCTEEKPLHVLINNAGCMVNKYELTEDNLEKNFATNTLGTHLLTMGLLPLLEKQSDPRVIIVSSGGMLVQKLDAEDLNLEKLQPFDGTMAYAQNKRQQIVMTQEYGKKHKPVHFSAMHPGWADTPAVRMSMPEFYEKMKNKLRTAEQGADTLVWLAVSNAASKHASGLFYQDRKPTAVHLPLAWTKSKAEEEALLMKKLDELATKFTSTSL